MKKRTLTFLVAFAIMISNLTTLPVREVAAAVVDGGIVTEGEGTLTQTLTNGKSVSVSLSNSIMSLTVDGQTWNYYDTPSVGTAVISDDDVLHVFWHSGHYYAFDLYEKDAYVMLGYNGVSQENVDYYIVSKPNDPNNVLGTSAGMSNKTCILDKKYFKMYGQVLKKRLITRAQLEELIYGKKPTPTPSTTPNPTAVPTSAPTEDPIVVPTMEPLPTLVPPTLPPLPTLSVPTKAPSPTLKPLPTQKPSSTPDVTIDTTIDWSQKTDYDIYLEWQKNFAAQMTWYAFAQVVWGESWKEHASSITVSDTRYEYDENGNLIHQVTVSTSNTETTGQGGGTAGVQAGGTATVTGTENGAAHLTGSSYNEGQAKIHTEIRGKTGGASQTKKDVITWDVKQPKGNKGWVKLTRKVNKKNGVITRIKVDYGKHLAWYGKKRYTKVVLVTFSLKSRQIMIKHSGGKWEVVPFAKGKGKYTSKKIKGVYNGQSISNSGFVYALNKVKKGKPIKTMGVSKIQPRKIK